jgi:hypothetical protein
MEAEIQHKKQIALLSKVPLIIDRWESNIHLSRECVESAWYEFSGKSLQWKPRYISESTMLFKYSALEY